MRIGIAAFDSILGSGGGVDVYTRYLIEALADNDADNSYYVLCDESERKSWAYRRWPPNLYFVDIFHVEPKQPLHVRAQRRVQRTLRQPVQAHYGEPYVEYQIDSAEMDLIHYPRHVIFPLSVKTPCVISFFDLQHEYYSHFFTAAELDWRARFYKPSVEMARCVIASSEFTKQTLAEKYGMPEQKARVVPVGISASFRRSSDSQVACVRLKYNLPEEFIYYPANPWPHKNHSRLMAALRIYQDRYGKPPVLVLSGRLRDEKRDAKELAIAAGVQDRIIDLGYLPRDEQAAVYASAAAMVFPSLFEGFGIPLLEAMACGCPIIAANATAIPEVVGDAAILFDPFDPGAIADAIHLLLTDEKLRAHLIACGYQQLGRYQWRDIIPRILKVYQQVAEAR